MQSGYFPREETHSATRYHFLTRIITGFHRRHSSQKSGFRDSTNFSFGSLVSMILFQQSRQNSAIKHTSQTVYQICLANAMHIFSYLFCKLLAIQLHCEVY